MKDNREYRDAQSFQTQDNFIIEGYVALFEPYVFYDDGTHKVYEYLHREALNGADLSDVILQIDHTGRVHARKSNGTLEVKIDDKGIFMRADLSRTEAGKELYNEVKQGMYKSMSYAFRVKEDYYDKATNTRHITKIEKVYDCSVVAYPANSNTSVSARSVFDGLIKPQIVEYEARTALIDEYIRKVANI